VLYILTTKNGTINFINNYFPFFLYYVDKTKCFTFLCSFLLDYVYNFYASIHKNAINKHSQSKFAKEPTHCEMSIFQI